ncbi:MAG: DUF559 domain-containing protein [Patescibacteria group bacterium]
MRKEKLSTKETVLVSVLKNPADLHILLTQKWYRIPQAFTPKKPFSHLAFYQPAIFKKEGKQIRYYAKILSQETAKRIDLLPHQPRHPHAQDIYDKYTFSTIEELPQPIKNIIPRRVSFGFTSLERLITATNLLELYNVPPIEQMIAQGLNQRGIPLVTEYPIGYSSGRFRIDLVVACKNGWLALECDNNQSHHLASQQQKDHHKDLVLTYHGWRVLRLREEDILDRFDRSLARIEMAISSLGGPITKNSDLRSFSLPPAR